MESFLPYVWESPANCGDDGGGGNRTRDPFLPYIDRLTNAAWRQHRRFDTAFQTVLFREQKRLVVGSRTRLYAICHRDAAAWKFGVALRPGSRLDQLQSGNAEHLVLYAHAAATVKLERWIHRVLRRTHLRGEWFAGTSRTLAVAAMLRSVEEQTIDVLACDGLPDDAELTMSMLTSCMGMAA